MLTLGILDKPVSKYPQVSLFILTSRVCHMVCASSKRQPFSEEHTLLVVLYSCLCPLTVA